MTQKAKGRYFLCAGCGTRVLEKHKECTVCGAAMSANQQLAMGEPDDDEVLGGIEDVAETGASEDSGSDPSLDKAPAPPPAAPESEPEAPTAEKRYVAAQPFTVMVGGQFMRFGRFQEIPRHLVAELTTGKHPVVDANAAEDPVCCPNCKSLFHVEQKRERRLKSAA